jgi:zinc protease
MNDLEHLSVQDVQDWYRTWYAPNNLTLIVAGDVNAQQVWRWANELYGPMKQRALPSRKPQIEPAQNGVRRVGLRAPAQNAFIMMGYKAPTLNETLGPLVPTAPAARDFVALGVLAALLDDPGTGRLTKRLVRDERVAVSVGAGADSIARGPGLFVIDVTASPGVSLAALESKVKEEIEKIAAIGVEEKELARIKRQAKASQVFKQDSGFSIAMEAARLLLAGRVLQDSENYLTVLDSIRVDDIQRVAKTFFSDHQLTVLAFEPLPLDQAAPRKPAAIPGMRH